MSHVCIVTTGHSSMYSKAYLDQVRSEERSSIFKYQRNIFPQFSGSFDR